ncbi:hypothetical protein BD324DRAFT_622664 [Kockovaella imperatae]|uniref:Uncharacterized protein n=1 Tax=Kockovaella imperatae TaxID=4999 RepID=A0A1Y1UHS7_9TREE|nr:hypothetical protein BD324DRAFT_622664 [Kockovaella imperatae]ORX37623.1 hypothetical protein BD324DRAFT_622664 [Kockovaella imperatae]
MNICFFLLLVILFALAVLTSWNKHVLLLLGVTSLFWFSMLWFIAEISKVQTRPDNMPPVDVDPPTSAAAESKKDR